MAKLAIALVLSDVVSHGLKPGHLVEASPDLIASLTKAGQVDPDKGAVAYARSECYIVLRSAVELAAEQRAAAISTLQVEIAKLEDLHAKAEADTKAALAAELVAQRAALAGLQA